MLVLQSNFSRDVSVYESPMCPENSSQSCRALVPWNPRLSKTWSRGKATRYLNRLKVKLNSLSSSRAQSQLG